MASVVAGGSLRTPFRIVRGAGTTEWNVRYWCSATGSIEVSMPPAASSAGSVDASDDRARAAHRDRHQVSAREDGTQLGGEVVEVDRHGSAGDDGDAGLVARDGDDLAHRSAPVQN